MNKLYKLTLLFLVYSNAVGQTLDPAYNSDNYHFEDLAVTKSLELDGDLGFTTTFVNNALIKNDYWSDDVVLNQINSLGQTNRLGGFIHTGITYNTGNTNGLYIGANYNTMLGVTSQKELIELALRGNQNQPTIDLVQKNAFEQMSYGSVSIGRVRYDSAKSTQIRYGLDFYSQQQFVKVVGNQGRFETDSSGEKLTVTDADVVVTQNLSNPFTSFGVGIDFEISRLFANDCWSFSLLDLGVIRSSEMRTATMLSNFVFDGFDVSSQVNSAGGIQIQDSFNQNFFETDTTSKIRLVPFQTCLQHVKVLGTNNSIDSRLTYIYFSGYYPLLETTYQQQFKAKSALWRVGARLGGFGVYGVQFGTVLPFGNGHSFKLDVVGLESMASSNLPVNWFGRFGLSIQL